MRYLFILFFSLASLFYSYSQETASEETRVTVSAKPIASFAPKNPSLTRFGALEFRGGLALSSSDSRFGGLSALNMEPDGEHFLALSDRGYWFRGRITYQDQRPSGIVDAEMSPILNAGGAESKWDAESLTRNGDSLYVGIERIHAIARFNYGADGLRARGEFIKAPDELKSLPANKGLESLVFVPEPHPLAGALLAISESGLPKEENIRAFIIDGPQPGSFFITKSGKFEISDAALLPNGDLLILERAFSVMEGLNIRIRRFDKSGIAPGATLEGRTLFNVDGNYEIDNMEALSLHKNSSGEIILTLLSDDNYSLLQRTLLLQFALRDDMGTQMSSPAQLLKIEVIREPPNEAP